jgi:Cellulose binding domain
MTTSVARPHRRRSAPAFALALTAASAVAAVAWSAPSAPADTGASCSAVYSIGWQTPSNTPPDFGATVTVTNNSSFTISTWTLTMTFSAGQSLVAGSAYSAEVTQSAKTLTATGLAGDNAGLAPGASTTFGFNGDYNGTSNPAPAITCAGPSEGSAGATLNGTLDPLGVNTASWDTNFTDSAISGDLNSADIGLIRYPGGSFADEYLWQPDTENGTVQPVDFAQYSNQVDAITGGQKFVTVNYGSDTPADAAAWVTQSETAGQGVSLWEIGNEEYGSWETDNHANPHTPASYASNALPYMQAMKAVNPNTQICYDYGMDGNLAPGSGATDWQTWNDTILQADAADINCADVHWYPFNGLPTENVQAIMATIDNIPAAAAEVHTALSTYDPSAYFVVGETNISQTANAWNEEPVGALYAAANAMEWLSFGAQSVDWWDVHNYGTPTADFGMFSSAISGEPAMDTPYAPYYGYQLASVLAVKGAKVGTVIVPTPNIYAYSSVLPGGGYNVMLVNADPSNAYTVAASSLGLTSGSETEYTYDAANPTIVKGTATGGSISVPAQSVVVLSGGTGTPPTGTPTPTPSVSASASASASASPSPTASTSPSQSASASASPTATGGARCTATWSVTNSWQGGFQLGFTVTDSGSAPTTGWTVNYSWPGSQAITQIWSAAETQSGAAVSVTNLSYDGSLSPGGSTTFGLLGSGATPTSLGNLSCTATG